MTFRTFCLMNDRRGQMKIKVCDSCFSISYFILTLYYVISIFLAYNTNNTSYNIIVL